MFRDYEHPIPNKKIWAAAYTDGKVECFELRTVYTDDSLPYYPLWHKEYPLGTAYSEFLYADLTAWDGHLKQIREHIEAINAGDNEKEHFNSLWEFSAYWLRQSPLFAPVAASIERLRLTRMAGESLCVSDLERQVAWFRDAQPKLKNLAQNLFETEDSDQLAERYIDLWRGNKLNYPTLSFGEVILQEVWRGGEQFISYDTISDIMARKDQQLEPQEFFVTEVISSQEPADIVNFMLSRYMQHGLQMKVCKYCGKYFGTKKGYKTDYCDRMIDGSTKTCRETGSLRLYEKRKMEDPAVREYKRSYKAHNARIRYGLMTREEFSAWSLEARKKRDLCISGKLSLEEFTSWLDSDKM